jgi:endonuclease-3 related protein
VRKASRGSSKTKRARATSAALTAIYARLYAAWGTQHWWPGETPFEVMVGAILTQNTAWTNVEKAITNVKAAGMLEPEALRAAPPEKLAALIRPSGYFNVKARRLRHFLEFLHREGGEAGLRAQPTGQLREKLLGVHGLGPDTADSILLYALDRPVFVIDAYTRRVLRRHRLIRGDEDYEELRTLFEQRLPRARRLYNEYHALFVRTGKYHCRPKARCEGCPLACLPHDARR